MNNSEHDKDKQVQYYAGGRFSDSAEEAASATQERAAGYGSASYSAAGYGSAGYGAAGYAPRRRRLPGWAKALIIIALVLLCIILLTVGCNRLIGNVIGSDSSSEVVTDFGHDYIGTIFVQGTIDESSSGTYNHAYLLNAIDAMIDDEDNKGLILYVNTPGGTVYASDELYLKIMEYKELTGRPVYSSMQSQATSGGYYISAASDKIIANRNCWTGSIGVTMGTFVDVSELLEKLGIKTQTITAGDNKAMGSTTEEMSDEQSAIYQSLVDEAYEQFVSIVAEGRGMSVNEVKKLADGRIYSAQQALDNGLIDQIGTYEEAIADMVYSYGLTDCYIESFQPDPVNTLSSLLGLLSDELSSSAATDAETIEALIDMNGSFELSYICNVEK